MRRAAVFLALALATLSFAQGLAVPRPVRIIKVGGQGAQLAGAAFSPDGKYVYTTTRERGVLGYRLSDGKELPLKGNELAVFSRIPGPLGWSVTSDGRIGANHAGSGKIDLVNLPNFTLRRTLQVAPTQAFVQHDLSRDGKLLAVGVHEPWEASTLTIWDTEAGRPSLSLKVGVGGTDKDFIYMVAMSDDNRLVGLVQPDRVAVVELGKRTTRFLPLPALKAFGEHLSVGVFSRDGGKFVSGAANGIIRIWNVGSGSLEAQFNAHDSEVLALDFDTAGKALVSSSTDGSLRVWSLR